MDYESRKRLLASNSETRIRSRDAFMLMALWMQEYPSAPKMSDCLPTGCVLVSPQERVVNLEHNGEAHAVVRALIGAKIDPKGYDIYVSRFPCSLCTKVMVQAGIRKCYYFPAEHWEMHSDDTTDKIQKNQPHNTNRTSFYGTSPVTIYSHNFLNEMATEQDELKERNRRSVQRLIANNSIALSLFIPQWDHSDVFHMKLQDFELPYFQWPIDPSIEHIASTAWHNVKAKFKRTQVALNELYGQYNVTLRRHFVENGEIVEENADHPLPPLAHHAMVLAHIAARRTDDPKVGVGAILVHENHYVSVGWNGFPKKSQHLDYPQAGADDLVDDSELKYNYSLHAEQNALLWRNPPGLHFTSGTGSFLVTTKMPCDECAPMVCDMGICTVYTNRQNFRSTDDPLRHRGLTYDKCHILIPKVFIFNTE